MSPEVPRPCPGCAAEVPHAAQHCPTCGRPVPGGRPGASRPAAVWRAIRLLLPLHGLPDREDLRGVDWRGVLVVVLIVLGVAALFVLMAR
jgi:hypothetical protein